MKARRTTGARSTFAPSAQNATTKLTANPLTGRQQQVLALVGRGMTNKEIAHELGITERGVAAHISRLLASYHQPNRAGLMTRVLTGLSGDAVVNEKDLAAYKAAAFVVIVTLGPDHAVFFRNDVTQRLFPGGDVSVVDRPIRDSDQPATIVWRRIADQVFKTGVVATLQAQPARWQRSDGTWVDASFNSILQPLRDGTGTVRGIVWISMVVPPAR
jgi:DNA-binding CsgD family transcriptional regulator